MIQIIKNGIKFFLKFIGIGSLSYYKRKQFYKYGIKSEIASDYLQLMNPQNISIGNKTTILSGYRLAVYGDSRNSNISIGDNCYIGFGFSALCSATGKILIGNDVLCASNICITNENHGMNPELAISYMDQELMTSDVIIGDGCWIGQNVCILPGVRIGKQCIIGAGSIVTKSAPDYSMLAGNPASIIKEYNFENHKWEKKL